MRTEIERVIWEWYILDKESWATMLQKDLSGNLPHYFLSETETISEVL